MMGGMGGLGLLACLVGVGLTLLVFGGLAALVVWAFRMSGERERPTSSASVTPAGTLGKVDQPAILEVAPVCPNCGRPVQAGWAHCAHCGAPLGQA